jgi:hypothetical protein
MVTGIEVLGSSEPIHSSTEILRPSRFYLVPSAGQGSDGARPTLSRSSQKSKMVGTTGGSKKRKRNDEQRIVDILTASEVLVDIIARAQVL